MWFAFAVLAAAVVLHEYRLDHLTRSLRRLGAITVTTQADIDLIATQLTDIRSRLVTEIDELTSAVEAGEAVNLDGLRSIVDEFGGLAEALENDVTEAPVEGAVSGNTDAIPGVEDEAPAEGEGEQPTV